jgi:hypothetical protein
MERGVMAAAGSVGKLGVGLVSMLAIASISFACSDDDTMPAARMDASTHTPTMPGSHSDGGSAEGSGDSGSSSVNPRADAGPVAPTAGSGSAPVFSFDGGIGIVPVTGSVCTLGVGATCDGPEDCPVPQSCCAVFDAGRFTYMSIGCALNCDALNEFELCHPDQGCNARGRVCRRSAIVPHDFITVCVEPVAVPVPTETTSEAISDKVMCGADLCTARSEQCCLRSEFDFANRMSIALEPYCARARAIRCRRR